MAINFPDAPTLGQVFNGYVWDSEKWLSAPIALVQPKKNYALNGGMQISQQFGTAGQNGNGYYPVDQFYCSFATTAGHSFGQSATPTPGGSPFRILWTVGTPDATAGAGEGAWIGHPIEGNRVADLQWGTGNAKTIVVRFGVRGPAGTYCVIASTQSANRNYIAEYTITAGEANTDVVKSVIIPGDTIGTWPKDNTVGLIIKWMLMTGSDAIQPAGAWGSTYTLGSANQINVFAAVNNFYLFDVGVYEGTVAPPWVLPDFVSELALCQRYWEKSYLYSVAQPTNTPIGMVGSGAPSGSGIANFYSTIYFKTKKRATPSLAVWSGPGGANQFSTGPAGTDSISTIGANNVGDNSFTIGNSGTPTNLGVFFHYVANSRLM